MPSPEERTPEQHRREVERWRASAPANDNAILRPPRTSASPKHAGLAPMFEPLRKWFIIQAEAEAGPYPLAWLEAANDNDDLSTQIDTAHVARPREGEMMAAVKGVEFKSRRVFRYDSAKRRCMPALDEVAGPQGRFPSGGDVEYGAPVLSTVEPPEGRPAKTVRPLVRMGGLRFSTAYLPRRDIVGLTPRGGLLAYHAGQPGAETWRLVQEFSARRKGNDGPRKHRSLSDLQATLALRGEAPPASFERESEQYQSASEVARRCDAAARVAQDAGRQTRIGDWAVELGVDGSVPLAEARAKAGLPPAEKGAPVLPGLGHPADCFLAGAVHGSKTASPGGSGTDYAFRSLQRMAAKESAARRFGRETETVIDAFRSPLGNFRELGEMFGHSGKVAERRGKAVAIKAMAELQTALEAEAA